MKGLGIDLCRISRMETILQEQPRFLSRYYTDEEQRYLAGRGKCAAESAAAMFAAKEAFLKALRTGLGSGVSLNEIGVVHLESGAPEYQLTGAALEAVQQLGIQALWLSLTHEDDHAAAVCVLE